jgi:hypothetical protein
LLQPVPAAARPITATTASTHRSSFMILRRPSSRRSSGRSGGALQQRTSQLGKGAARRRSAGRGVFPADASWSPSVKRENSAPAPPGRWIGTPRRPILWDEAPPFGAPRGARA